MAAKTDFAGYGITELRTIAREESIPGRTRMSGPELLAAVRGVWNARRVAAERQVLPAVRVGAYLRYRTHTDCVIRVTSTVQGWTELSRSAEETTPLYVEAVYVSMCSNCDHGRQGGPAVTEKYRMDYHNQRATGSDGYRPSRFMLWNLEPASAEQTADAMAREPRPKPKVDRPAPGFRETVRCETHDGAHFERDDCARPHYTDQVTRSQLNAEEWRQAWARYRANHPEVAASWGQTNGRWPTCTCAPCQPVPAAR